MDNKLSAGQLKCIKAITGKLKLPDVDAMVLGFTGMRTGHVSDMSVTEAITMIKHLKGLDPDERKAELMRKKLIAMAYERAGLPRSASKEQKQAAVDGLNGWCKQYGYKKKGLNAYTLKELPKLVSQYEILMGKLVAEL